MLGINVFNLCKTYKSEIIEEGIKGSIKGIFKRRYKETRAIDDVSVRIEKGEMIGLIGPNGAGKTTFLKLLTGVLYPDKGKIYIDRFEPAKRDKNFLENITFFTGQRSFLSVIIWDIAPREGFELIRHIYNIDKETYKIRLSYLTELLNAGEIITKPLRKLSLGERTKVEIIASLLHFPSYVFLDEPTIGLDVISQKTLWDFFKRYNKENGATLIITSHYVRDIEELGKRIIILNKGKILYDGDKENIRDKISDKKIIRFKTTLENFKIPFDNFEREEDNVMIEVDKKEIDETLKKIMNTGEIEDIEIREPTFEMIIREIFKNESEDV